MVNLPTFGRTKREEDTAMKDWMDFNGNGEVDSTEKIFADEMLCASREEHIALFGDAGDFGEEVDEEKEDDLMYAGFDRDDLEMMEPEDRREVLEEAGLDPDDYDFD